LGTTFSAVAYLGDDGKPRVLPNREGEDETPSVVFFPPGDGKDEPLVGTMAKNSISVSSDDVVQFVKRSMGNPDWRFVSSTGEEYSPEEISAIILRRLVADAEEALGEPVAGAVITVPAYFGDARRTATLQAAEIAGVNVLALLNEPTAAALAFGVEAQENATVLVYDLGGGTFDVTIMQFTSAFEGPQWIEIGKRGDSNLGGFNWDNEMVKLIMRRIAEQGGPKIADDDLDEIAQLREKAEDAKRTLTTVTTATLVYAFQGKPYRIRITREEFEQATANLLGRTRSMVEDTLDESNLSWEEIDNVLLVGGSTFMPQVSQMLHDVTGKRPLRTVDPKQAVALGAGVRAGFFGERGVIGAEVSSGDVSAQEGPVVEDVRPIIPRDTFRAAADEATGHALGVVMLDATDGKTEVNIEVIPRNTNYSKAVGEALALTRLDKQPTLTVRVTQGDGRDLRWVTQIGSVTFPIPEYPAGARFTIRYQYDSNERIFVEVIDEQASRSLGVFPVKRKANLDQRQVSESRTKVMGLIID
jgi:molecular chaperone DnaK